MLIHSKKSLLLAFSLALFPCLVHAQSFLDPAFSGVTQYDGWANLNSTNFPGYGGYPGSTPWPSPILANQVDSGDGGFNKTSGNGYPLSVASGNYVYVTQPGGGTSDPTVAVGSFAVSDQTPVSGLKNVLFQSLMGGALMMGGEYVEFASGIYPVLSYNGGAQNLTATYYDLLWEGELSADQGDGYGYLRAFQWDLSGIVDPISSFSISWSNTNHAQIYEMQLNQSDVFTQVVPEPSAFLLVVSGMSGILFSTRRRFNRK